MKKHLLFIFILVLGSSIKAETKFIIHSINFDEIVLKDNKIILSGKLLGTVEVKTKDINVSNKEKTTIYDVTIFNQTGGSVAKLDLKVVEQYKKKSFSITDATLKTIRDNVSHNPSNFIVYEYNLKEKKSDVPQFDNVVKYLLTYKYL